MDLLWEDLLQDILDPWIIIHSIQEVAADVERSVVR